MPSEPNLVAPRRSRWPTTTNRCSLPIKTTGPRLHSVSRRCCLRLSRRACQRTARRGGVNRSGLRHRFRILRRLATATTVPQLRTRRKLSFDRRGNAATRCDTGNSPVPELFAASGPARPACRNTRWSRRTAADWPTFIRFPVCRWIAMSADQWAFTVDAAVVRICETTSSRLEQ